MLEFGGKTYRRIFNFCANRPFTLFLNYPLFFRFLGIVKEATNTEISQRANKFFLNSDSACCPGLYIHIPFCESRCSFCRFYSIVPPTRRIIDDYLDALEFQAEMLLGGNFSNGKLQSIYLGGGTPTFLSKKQFLRLFQIIHRFFNFDNREIQVSCEATPQSVTKIKARLLRRLGINRISLGVQTLNDEILRQMGQRYLVSDVFRAVDFIRESGIPVVSVDLLIGLRGETRISYRKTTNRALRLAPDGIECFFLESAAGGKVGRDFNKIIKELQRNLCIAYDVYEKGIVSRFIKKGKEPEGIINQNIKQLFDLQPCLGLGASAYSYFPGVKIFTPPNINDFIRFFKYDKYKNDCNFFYVQHLSKDDQKRNFIISSIARARQLDKKKYIALFRSDFAIDFFDEIKYLKKNGILAEDKDKFIWNLKKDQFGSFGHLLHVLKFWYHPKYIRQAIRKIHKMTTNL